MSLSIRVGRGKRRAITLPEALAEIDRLNALADALNTENVKLICETSRNGITIATQATKLELADKMLRFWAGKVVRAEAEQERLRQAVINARPRITQAYNPARIPPFAPTAPDEPWTVLDPETTLSIPIGRWLPFPPDPDGDTTQELALGILDLPGPRPAGWESLAKQKQPA